MGADQPTMWQTIGHDKAIASLERAVENGRLSHAYLLTGPPRVGKRTLALDIARAVNCIADGRPCDECRQCQRVSKGLHADVAVIELEPMASDETRLRTSISIAQVREAQEQAVLKPYEGRGRVFILENAELLSEEAANALLKTLEEPPDQVTIVLLATSTDSLPETIVSRCTGMKLRPLSHTVIEEVLRDCYSATPELATRIAHASQGRLGWGLEALADPALLEARAEQLGELLTATYGTLEQRFELASTLAASFTRDRGEAVGRLALWLGWWRDVMVAGRGAPELVANVDHRGRIDAAAATLAPHQVMASISAINETWDRLEANVNPRLALEGLMLSLPRPGSPDPPVTADI